MTSDLLEFATLIVTGFASCAEFGSYAFVHPVIRRLPPEHHVNVEKGLLKTFGRLMPVLMTLCPVLSIAYAIQLSAAVGPANTIRWSSAIVFVGALISTFIFNVPINLATGAMESGGSPSELERNTKSMGAFPRHPVLASINRIPSCLPCSSNARLKTPVFRSSLGFLNQRK